MEKNNEKILNFLPGYLKSKGFPHYFESSYVAKTCELVHEMTSNQFSLLKYDNKIGMGIHWKIAMGIIMDFLETNQMENTKNTVLCEASDNFQPEQHSLIQFESIMKMINQGILSFDEQVERYIDELKEDGHLSFSQNMPSIKEEIEVNESNNMDLRSLQLSDNELISQSESDDDNASFPPIFKKEVKPVAEEAQSKAPIHSLLKKEEIKPVAEEAQSKAPIHSLLKKEEIKPVAEEAQSKAPIHSLLKKEEIKPVAEEAQSKAPIHSLLKKEEIKPVVEEAQIKAPMLKKEDKPVENKESLFEDVFLEEEMLPEEDINFLDDRFDDEDGHEFVNDDPFEYQKSDNPEESPIDIDIDFDLGLDEEKPEAKHHASDQDDGFEIESDPEPIEDTKPNKITLDDDDESDVAFNVDDFEMNEEEPSPPKPLFSKSHESSNDSIDFQFEDDD